MKFNWTKDYVGHFAYDFKILQKMIAMAYYKILEHFEESCPPKTESQFLEIDDMDTIIVKARVLILLFEIELHQTNSSFMLGHRTNMSDHVP